MRSSIATIVLLSLLPSALGIREDFKHNEHSMGLDSEFEVLGSWDGVTKQGIVALIFDGENFDMFTTTLVPLIEREKGKDTWWIPCIHLLFGKLLATQQLNLFEEFPAELLAKLDMEFGEDWRHLTLFNVHDFSLIDFQLECSDYYKALLQAMPILWPRYWQPDGMPANLPRFFVVGCLKSVPEKTLANQLAHIEDFQDFISTMHKQHLPSCDDALYYLFKGTRAGDVTSSFASYVRLYKDLNEDAKRVRTVQGWLRVVRKPGDNRLAFLEKIADSQLGDCRDEENVALMTDYMVKMKIRIPGVLKVLEEKSTSVCLKKVVQAANAGDDVEQPDDTGVECLPKNMQICFVTVMSKEIRLCPYSVESYEEHIRPGSCIAFES